MSERSTRRGLRLSHAVRVLVLTHAALACNQILGNVERELVTDDGDSGSGGMGSAAGGSSAGGSGAGGAASGGGPAAGGGGMGDGGAPGTGGRDGGALGGGGNRPDDAGVDGPPAPRFPLVLGAVLMFDSTCPAGFTELTDTRDRFLRGHDGDTERAEVGGTASHTHDIGGHTHVALSAGTEHTHAITVGAPLQKSGHDTTASLGAVSTDNHGHPGTGSDPGGGPHEHTIPPALPMTSAAASNLPAYREVVVCRLELAESAVPRQAMLFGASACASGFDEVLDARDRMLLGHDGDATFGETGGSDSHVHTFTHDHGGTTDSGGAHAHAGTTAANAVSVQVQRHADEQVASGPTHAHALALPSDVHAHSFAGPSTLAPASSLPRYHEVVLCRAGNQEMIPSGTLVPFDDVVCPSGFTEAAAFQERFLRGHDGDATPGERSGSDTHSHASAHDHGGTTASIAHSHGGSITTGAASANVITATCCRGASGPRSAATGGHTHAATVAAADLHAHPIGSASPSVTDVTLVPPYRELIVCEKD